MNKKIFRASFFTVLLVLVATVVLILGTLFHYFEKELQAELENEAEILSWSVERDGMSFFEGFDEMSHRVTWIDADGKVLFDSKANEGELENHADREEIREAMETGRGMSVRYSTTLMEKSVNYAVRLMDGGVLRVSANQYTIVMLFLEITWPILVILFVAMIVTFVLSSKVAEAIVEPINKLDLDSPEKNDAYEELSPLLLKIAEQKQTIEEQLAESQKTEDLRREFTANVSHELKTPLTSISGFAELMKAGDVSADVAADFSKSIYDEAQRLITLVNDIIKISELDGRSVPYQRESVELYGLAEEVIGRLESQAVKKGVTFRLSGDKVQIQGVRKILDEMLYNLCDNAIKYNRENGTVDVEIKDMRQRVYVVVKDSGIGIPAEHQARVFERFYRVDKSHSKNIGGTGLGLAIVKHAALYHHASIRLESAEGEGTTVTVGFNGR